MAILLVVGVMDLRAMAVVTIAITLERVAPDGQRIARAIGAVVVGAGLLLIAQAAGLATPRVLIAKQTFSTSMRCWATKEIAKNAATKAPAGGLEAASLRASRFRQSTGVPTVTRMPRIHGFPPITAGSRVIRVSCGMLSGSTGPSSYCESGPSFGQNWLRRVTRSPSSFVALVGAHPRATKARASRASVGQWLTSKGRHRGTLTREGVPLN